MQIKSTIRYHLTPVRMAIIKKSTIIAREDVERRNALTLLGESTLVQPLWRTVQSLLKKLKRGLQSDPATLLLCIYLEKNMVQKDACTPMFTAALFSIAQTWKQCKYLLIDEWISKMCCVCVYTYTHTHTHTKWSITQPLNRIMK